MIHTTLFSLLSAIDSTDGPLHVAITTKTLFVQQAVRDAFESHCTRGSLPVQKYDYHIFEEEYRRGQTQLFQGRRGIILFSDTKRKNRFRYEPTDSILLISPQHDVHVHDHEFSSWHLFCMKEQKPWDVTNLAVSWCERYVKKQGLSTYTANMLGALVEANDGAFFSVKTELEKLVTYTLGSQPIPADELCEISDISKKASLFRLFDEILALSRVGIIREVELIERDGSIHIFQFVRFFQQQARNLAKSAFYGETNTYMSRAAERRTARAREIGVCRLEEWISRAISLEVGMRNGEECDDLSFRLDSFCLSLIPYHT